MAGSRWDRYVFDPFDEMDKAIAGTMAKYGNFLLRVSLGAVFVWFGGLKLIGASPANELVERTVYWLPKEVFIPILGVWETAIGVCLLYRPWIRAGIALMLAQMAGTFLPLILLPEICFTRVPWLPTMEGQYIIKNLVLISAAIVVGGTVRHRPHEGRFE